MWGPPLLPDVHDTRAHGRDGSPPSRSAVDARPGTFEAFGVRPRSPRVRASPSRCARGRGPVCLRPAAPSHESVGSGHVLARVLCLSPRLSCSREQTPQVSTPTGTCPAAQSRTARRCRVWGRTRTGRHVVVPGLPPVRKGQGSPLFLGRRCNTCTLQALPQGNLISSGCRRLGPSAGDKGQTKVAGQGRSWETS